MNSRVLPKVCRYFLSVSIIFFIFFCGKAEASITHLDTSFNGSGIMEINRPNWAGGWGSDLQSDGKFVTAGFLHSGGSTLGTVWRFTTDGLLDSTFNGSGTYQDANAQMGDIKVQADGKLLVCGAYLNQLALFRFNSDGTLDTSFDTDGMAVTSLPNSSSFSVYITSDGKYLVAGNDITSRPVLVKFNNNGSLDTSFASGGVLSYSSGMGTNEWSSEVREDSNGNYTVLTISNAGTYNLWRFDVNGNPDLTFNGGSFLNIPYPLFISNLLADNFLILPDGKILIAGPYVVGSGQAGILLVRVNPNGTFDTTFSPTGHVVYDDPSRFSEGVQAIDIDNNGKILVAGGSRDISSENTTPTIWRFNQDGTLDTSFNSTGFIRLPLSYFSVYETLEVQDDGKYIAVGRGEGMNIVRYENLYQIANLPTELDATVSQTNIETGSTDGVYGTYLVQLDKNSIPIADIPTQLIDDRDWSSVTADTTLTEYKSYVNGISSSPGVSGSFDLYVPKRDGDDAVGICPNVTSLEETNSECNGLQVLSSDSSNVTEVNIDGQDYWVVSGQSGTGGFSGSMAILAETGSQIHRTLILYAFVSPLLLPELLQKLHIRK